MSQATGSRGDDVDQSMMLTRVPFLSSFHRHDVTYDLGFASELVASDWCLSSLPLSKQNAAIPDLIFPYI